MSALIRWDPFSELNNLHAQVNSLFNDTFGGMGSSGIAPSTDVYTTDNQLVIKTHLAGFNEDEISVEQHEGNLTIKAEHQEKEESKDKKYLVRESVNRYYRSFSLPRNADADNVQAEFKDGILQVTVPYKELPQPKKVNIKPSKAKNK